MVSFDGLPFIEVSLCVENAQSSGKLTLFLALNVCIALLTLLLGLSMIIG
jgi:hypothetical protein